MAISTSENTVSSLLSHLLVRQAMNEVSWNQFWTNCTELYKQRFKMFPWSLKTNVQTTNTIVEELWNGFVHSTNMVVKMSCTCCINYYCICFMNRVAFSCQAIKNEMVFVFLTKTILTDWFFFQKWPYNIWEWN